MNVKDDRYPKSRWVFRNHFACGQNDIESMERLEKAGLVKRGKPYGEHNYFHATKEGCKAISMNSRQIKNAFSD